MRLLIPHLFPTARFVDAYAVKLRAPALETMLGRGRVVSSPVTGVDAAVCEVLGLAWQRDCPVAPMTLEADGGEAGRAYWLRADPVHWRVMRDRIVLDRPVRDLTMEDAASLATSITDHFGSDLSVRPLASARWYVELPEAPRLHTTPIDCAVGRDIEPRMPCGQDALSYRAMLTEVQMLLHDHPVNARREARGQVPVNALWLWGGGVLPSKPANRVLDVITDDESVIRLARWAGQSVRSPRAGLKDSLAVRPTLVVLGHLVDAAQAGDAHGWSVALENLEQNWFGPLQRARTRAGSSLTIQDPINGYELQVASFDRWKFWKRPRELRTVHSST